MNFNSVADRYSKISITQKSAAKRLLEYISEDNYYNILDVGSASGVNTKQLMTLLKEGGVYIGIDPSQKMIEKAFSEKIKNSQFICSYFENFNSSNKFNLIFCNSVFYYFKDTSAFFKKSNHLLSHNGVVAIQSQTQLCDLFDKALAFAMTFEKTIQEMKNFILPANLLSENDFLNIVDEQPYFKITKYKCCVDYHKVNTKTAMDIFMSGPAIPCLAALAKHIELRPSFKDDFLNTINMYIENQSEHGIVSLNSPRIYILLSRV